MWDKLEEVAQRYEELGQMLSSPEIAANPKKLAQFSKEHKELTPVVSAFRQYKTMQQELAGSKEVIESTKDPEMIALAREEIGELEEKIEQLQDKLKILLLPKDPNDSKNVILEIRAGAGGNEAGIFAGDLFRMYTRYAENQGWRVDVMGISEAPSGGYKEIIAMIQGDGAFSRFKYERGVHRVQRVPVTEAQGRIHTSTVTVAVLPEAEDVEIHINEKDLKIDVFRAGGPGGQSVNTTDSAVRITHLPTGMVVSMQDEKSQIKNKEKGLKVLRARLLEKAEADAAAERADARRTQVGTGDRSEKIRTYNYPQSRVTDHRIGLTVHSLDQVINGDLDQMVEPLTAYFQAEALKEKSAGIRTMASVRDAVARAEDTLRPFSSTPRLDVEVLLAHVLGCSRAGLIARFNEPFLAEPEREFNALLARRAAREPLAYIIGRKEFWGLDFEVSPAVLVPRPETELMVEGACEFIDSRSGPLRVLDLGTGSGCIAAAVATELKKRGRHFYSIATDISAAALEVARRNFARHNLDIVTAQGDWFEPLTADANFDLILSNPPYIDRENDPAGPELAFEPERALYSGEKGLEAIRSLVEGAASRLLPGGRLQVEIGSNQGSKVSSLLSGLPEQWWSSWSIRKDLAGLERMVVLERAGSEAESETAWLSEKS